MTNRGMEPPRVRPKTERTMQQLQEKEAEEAREQAAAEEEAARIKAESEAGTAGDLVTYLRHANKEKITFNLSEDICEAHTGPCQAVANVPLGDCGTRGPDVLPVGTDQHPWAGGPLKPERRGKFIIMVLLQKVVCRVLPNPSITECRY